MAEDENKIISTNTFVVQVRYRRNGTWQGSVSWMNGNKKSDFRSVLELLKLMEETMDNNGTCPEETKSE